MGKRLTVVVEVVTPAVTVEIVDVRFIFGGGGGDDGQRW
jgi:hypothetical protein